jgi:NADPH:quinone reductase-like Zn-dependent oxidoreductase
MKAVVCTGYGGPEKLELREVPKPSPKRSDILIKVKATTVTAGDCRMRRFHCPPMLWIPARIILGIFRPRKNIFGMEIAGVVEAVGAEVERFVPGDEVFASTEMLLGGLCGILLSPGEYCYRQETAEHELRKKRPLSPLGPSRPGTSCRRQK